MTLGIAIVILFVITTINMPDYSTELAVGLTLLLPIIGYWGFKPSIERFLERRKESNKVKREIGKPNSIEKGIQHYNSRERIPLKEILDNTNDSVDMSALTFTVIRYEDSSLIERKLKKGIKFTFILPDINSKIIDRHTDRYPLSDDLKNQIEKTLSQLCNLKKRFEENIIIKVNSTDNFDNSIIHVDKNKPEKAFIKVESRPIGKSNKERTSDLVIKEDNEEDYSEFKKLYDDLLDSSKDYVC